jgi:hypothetical protein
MPIHDFDNAADCWIDAWLVLIKTGRSHSAAKSALTRLFSNLDYFGSLVQKNSRRSAGTPCSRCNNLRELRGEERVG